MERYSLPLELTKVNLQEEISVDMSSLNFDVPAEKMKRSSFIYLRNAGVKATLDFSGCSYDDKAEFLLLYLQEEIDVDCDILTSTWIEILSAKDGGGVNLPSILTAEEIDKFIQENKTFVSEIYRLINSLPIFSMYCSPYNGGTFNTNDFEKSDWHGVKITNFSKLAAYDQFALLIDTDTPGVFYEKLFIKNEPHICRMMDRLPFLNLLNVIMAPPEVQAKALEAINNFLTPAPPVEIDISKKEETSDE